VAIDTSMISAGPHWPPRGRKAGAATGLSLPKPYIKTAYQYTTPLQNALVRVLASQSTFVTRDMHDNRSATMVVFS